MWCGICLCKNFTAVIQQAAGKSTMATSTSLMLPITNPTESKQYFLVLETVSVTFCFLKVFGTTYLKSM